MPRDGSGVYHTPAGTDGVPDTTIDSSKYNTNVHDVENDLNTARPIVAGGTGATSADAALQSLLAEKATQTVTDYGSQVWMPGSFRSAAGATGAPNAHAFAGVCYIGEALINPPTNANVVVEARDLEDTVQPGAVYTRQKKAGAWSAWVSERAAIYAAPFDALAYNGMQINGACEVSQERGGTPVAAAVGAATYIQDGWRLYYTSAPLAISAYPQYTTLPAPGLSNCVLLSATTGKAALAAGDMVVLDHMIEGYRVARLGWGTANAQPLSIGFYVNASVVGTMAVVVLNGAGNRAYVADVVINAANTWEYKTLTLPGDTTGTWAKDNAAGLTVRFGFGAGSTNQAPAGSWQAGGPAGSSATTNFVAANGNNCAITGLIVLPGIELPSVTRAPLIMRPYSEELVICRRYYKRIDLPAGAVVVDGNAPGAGSNAPLSFMLDVTMRAVPTAATTAFTVVNLTTTAPNIFATSMYAMLNWQTSAAGRFYAIAAAGSAFVLMDARL
jgi:hypothetical protein